VVWNTNVASDSLLQYSTTHPIPAGAPRVYVPTPVTVHDIQLEGLTPGTLHYFRVTSPDGSFSPERTLIYRYMP